MDYTTILKVAIRYNQMARTSFDWNVIKEICTTGTDKKGILTELNNYTFNLLEFLGRGSSRNTYLYNSKYVLKIGRQQMVDFAFEQNATEVKISRSKYKDIIARVVDYDRSRCCKGPCWLLSELVRPINNKEEFKELAGIDFQTFCADIEYASMEGMNIGKNKFAKKVSQLVIDKSLITADITDLKHWGKTPDGRVVLLDYGYA